jgi:branched-chain amino acid transport system permease protein
VPTRALAVRQEDHLRLFPSWWNKVAIVIIGLAVVAYPFLASARWLTIGNYTLVAIVGAVGLMILMGFTGQISLGHAAFLALGSYAAAALGFHLGVPFWLGVPAAGIVAAAVGLAVGPFALRLRGLYLAIVTLGLIFLVNHLLRSVPSITGGFSGLRAPMHWWFTGAGERERSTFGEDVALGPLVLDFPRQRFYVFLVLALFTVWFAANLRRSRTGRAMASVRDRDIAAAVIGVSPARTKITAFGISSFFAGVAGAMFAYNREFISIDPPFELLVISIQYIAIIIIGGIGTVFGAVVGAIVFTMLQPFAADLAGDLTFLEQLTESQQETLLFAIVVGVFLITEPLGLYGVWLRIKIYFMAWPFRY